MELVLGAAALLSFVHGVFGLQNLNFFGEYVVFTPSTKAIKFDLQRDMDVLLLEGDANETSSPNYLYRAKLVLNAMGPPDPVNQTDNASQEYNIDFEVFKQGKTMLAGNYHLWNVSERDNIEIDWGSRPNAIQVLTEVDGVQQAIVSWRDRSKRASRVRHLGVRVADKGGLENQHSKWRLREASAKDFDIRKSNRMCDIKMLPDHPRGKPIPIYEIFITREQDESYKVSVLQNSVEIARAKTSKVDTDKVYVSWDYDSGVIMLGVKDDAVPLFLYQDTRWKSGDSERVQFVTYKSVGKECIVDHISNETFMTIPKLYPKYFKSSLTPTKSLQPLSANPVMETEEWKDLIGGSIYDESQPDVLYD